MVLDDPYFDAQWLRTAGHSGAGGAELGECLAVAGAIRGSDIESWYAAWLAMGFLMGPGAEPRVASTYRRAPVDIGPKAWNKSRSDGEVA